MQRRAFVTGLAAAAAFPLAARAGEAERVPVVALVFGATPLVEMAGPDPVSAPARAFLHSLRALGWIEGKNITIERRSAEGDPKRAPAIFAELAARGVDLIQFTGSRWNMEAARQATRTIPLVALFSGNPVADGYVASLARPGGNMTGVATTPGHELSTIGLQFLKDLAPGIAKVAFLGPREAWESFGKAVAFANLPPVFAQVDQLDQYEAAFAQIVREQADSLHVLDGTVNYINRKRIVAFAAERRLPTGYPNREAVDDGGLLSYGANILDIYRQLAVMVVKVLNGAKPADLPVEQPTKFELVINRKTATALGLTIPPLLLARADEVIE